VPLFQLAGAPDMLAKARREHVRLRKRVDIDTVFNFLVTAHHIRDYVENCGMVSKQEVERFAQDHDVATCRDLANTGKHLRLMRHGRVTPPNRVKRSYVGAGMVGDMMVGAGERWLLESGSHTVDIVTFADRLIAKWESFFAKHSI
jgi:hypothetical protein